jgi:methyl-accepting chemotaxis protein
MDLHLRLSHKIIAIAVLGVCGLATVGGIYLLGEASQDRSQAITDSALSASRLTNKITIEVLEARRGEKDFIIRSDEKYVERQREAADAVAADLSALKSQLETSGRPEIAKTAAEVLARFADYEKAFQSLADSRRKLGFTEKSGLEGALVNTVRGVEERLKLFDGDELVIDLLTLRRHEKNYMLRREASYVEAFVKTMKEMQATLTTSRLPIKSKEQVGQDLASYERDFLAWIGAAQDVAKSQQAMGAAFNVLEPQIEAMQQAITKIRDDAEAALSSSHAATKMELEIAILAVAAMVGLLGFLIARAVSKPLSAMTATMQHLAAGRLDAAIPGIGRHDEIGEMGGAVEVFKVNAVERLRLEQEQKETETRTAVERKAEMHRLADSFQAAIGAIVGTVASASSDLEAAATTLTRTAETTQQLSTVVAGASEEASSNVQSVASATEELTSSIDEIGRQVLESSNIARTAVGQAQQTDARINELSQAAGRIGDVVKLITAVAEQNVLALTATIDAAGAGEAGRGFAVVASEVKSLAAQTAKATEEISSQIAHMQTATQDSVAAIKEIGTTIGRISEISTTIASAVEEQGAATQEISRNVQQAAKGTTQVASNIVEVNEGAGATGAASGQVLSSAQALSAEGNKLKTEVNRFLATIRAA